MLCCFRSIVDLGARVYTGNSPACRQSNERVDYTKLTNLQKAVIAAEKKRSPRNPRVRVATATCRDATQALVQGQDRGTTRDAIYHL